MLSAAALAVFAPNSVTHASASHHIAPVHVAIRPAASAYGPWRTRLSASPPSPAKSASSGSATAATHAHAAALASTAPLVAPAASLVSATGAQINLAAAAAAGGSGSYTYQWYRSTSAGFVPSPATVLTGATELALTDSVGLAGGVPYFYVLSASDGTSTVYSNQVIGALSLPTAPIDLPYQPGPVLMAYLGSSTWAINQGSGQVPWLVDGDLHAAQPAATLMTFDGAVSGTTTASFLPGQPYSNAVKSAVMNFSGYKVLRMMIGSNDAAGGEPVATWLANMQTIIHGALAWPVDEIVLEEIGVRLDGGNATLDLIRQYNAARASLVGPKVVLGTAHTFENQAVNLSTLSGDQIHQTNAGQINLATNQATELMAPLSAPSTLNVSGDNVSWVVSVDATGSVLQISPGTPGGGPSAAPLYRYPLASVGQLTINLLGANDSLTFDFTNGSAVPLAGIVVGGNPTGQSRLCLLGQAPGQAFSLTDYQITPASGGSVSFQNVSELYLSRGTYNFAGSLSTVDQLDLGAQSNFDWN